MCCPLNGRELSVPADDAVETVLKVAAGELDEAGVAAGWPAAQPAGGLTRAALLLSLLLNSSGPGRNDRSGAEPASL
jgi:hypothetical protein